MGSSIANTRPASRPSAPARGDLRAQVLAEIRAVRARLEGLEQTIGGFPAPVPRAVPRRPAGQVRRHNHYRQIERAHFRGRGPALDADVVFPTPCASCRSVSVCGPYCECTCHGAAAGARR
jgi:hypothetical protein